MECPHGVELSGKTPFCMLSQSANPAHRNQLIFRLSNSFWVASSSVTQALMGREKILRKG